MRHVRARGHGDCRAPRGGSGPRARRRPPALEAAVAPASGGVCIGVSHDGGTRATELALEAARDAGARTALITAVPQARAAAAAGIVVVTPLHDESWCHTVAYTSAILAGAALARELGLAGIDAMAADATLREALDRPAPDVTALAAARRVLPSARAPTRSPRASSP